MSTTANKKQQEFLKHVIDMAFLYLEESTSTPNSVEFAGYLTRQHEEKTSQQEKTGQQNETGVYRNSPADELGMQLVLLNRYARLYVKIALSNTILQTADEFPMLMILFAGGSRTKTELFEAMLLTKTTGTEIVKRLKSKGLLTENMDENDKRSKQVDLSEEGRKLVLGLLPRMSRVSQLISGNLDIRELGTIIHLLKKLSDHHRNFFAETSDEDLENTIRK